ncbi:hypothetical protein SNE40_013721 [Patella caerulea]|uniref:Uncharacterized protein n=1 Tax=Patella caerulea TaxID=87958 RepID=A0AAN8PHM4_PATCE
MEVDSVHSSIERKLRKQPIYCPQQYVDYIKKARTVPRPYNVKYIAHDFFNDYKILNYYSSIRPGKKVGDPVVNDIRVLKYNPGKDGRIEFKLHYSDEFQELPRRFFVKSPGGEEVGKAYTVPLKIKASKYNHLQELKSVIPKDYHSFYDNLLH